MRILKYNEPNFERKAAKIFNRQAVPADDLRLSVQKIISMVQRGGDKALSALTQKYDGASINSNDFLVKRGGITKAKNSVSSKVKKAVGISQVNVKDFALRGLRKSWKMKNAQGATVGEMFQPFSRVGVYVPGGSAPLVSTSLMTVAIAKAAGVKEIVVCTPPGADGEINAELLYALDVSGATEIYKVGGAQAIAAMSIGTSSIGQVEKVFGPGNSFVVEAKRQLFGFVAVDLLPGPSEIFVLADASARADWIASDLLAQAEHGGDSQIAFATTSVRLLESVRTELNSQAKLLKRKKQISEVMRKGTALVLLKSIKQGVELANDFAPEHLSLIVKNQQEVLPKLKACGAVFIGSYSPVSVGDFLAGPSHTLPTGGAGKSFPGLTADMFQRRTSVVELDKKSLKKSIPVVEVFAEIEGLDAHGNSARIREVE
ncbi:MAG: histidinol dehydrogenase [Verrucomicrobiota bacterium]|nr:histidinol dehydrogenase [Verrucomicrobiota bacterium]